ncbi:putative RNA methyltransferase [Bifidobacterium sp.]|uniref:putative RNA methyltransferase n=1 Tax=Bifidobacterium sp. TaxID=41200 RepID=UPI0039EAEB5E
MIHMKPSIRKFLDAAETFQCPICGDALAPSGTSLRCSRNHTFDIAAKGYASFLNSHRGHDGLYSQSFFENRSQALSTGLYDHIIRKVAEAVIPCMHSDGSALLDVGCGDGTLTKQLQRLVNTADAAAPAVPEASLYACDISAPAISIAARGGGNIRWFIADLAQLPLSNGSMNVITDIFSPANYGEFKRVLVPDGRLVKVVPGRNHLVELRETIAHSHQEKPDVYSNDDVFQGIERHCTIRQVSSATATIPLSSKQWERFLAMTPLMFHVRGSSIDLASLHELTIEAEIVEATMR